MKLRKKKKQKKDNTTKRQAYRYLEKKLEKVRINTQKVRNS